MFAAFGNAMALAAASQVCSMSGCSTRCNRPTTWRSGSVAGSRGAGGQMYLSFELSTVDVERFGVEGGKLIEAHEATRSTVRADGRLLVLPAVEPAWRIPVFDADVDQVRLALTGRTFPPGRWPQFDIMLTRRGAGAVLHCVFDPTIFDGYSIHRLCRELLARYADLELVLAAGADRPGVGRALRLDQQQHHQRRPAAAYYQHYSTPVVERQRGLLVAAGRAPWPAGGRWWYWPRSTVPVSTWCCWPCSPTHSTTRPTSRYRSCAGPRRPGRCRGSTRYSAGSVPAAVAPCWHRRRLYQRQIDADPVGPASSGLTELRRRVLAARGSRRFDHPVVYTCVVDAAELPPIGTAVAGPWLSCTPDVSLDCIGLVTEDTLHYHSGRRRRRLRGRLPGHGVPAFHRRADVADGRRGAAAARMERHRPVVQHGTVVP